MKNLIKWGLICATLAMIIWMLVVFGVPSWLATLMILIVMQLLKFGLPVWLTWTVIASVVYGIIISIPLFIRKKTRLIGLALLTAVTVFLLYVMYSIENNSFVDINGDSVYHVKIENDRIIPTLDEKDKEGNPLPKMNRKYEKIYWQQQRLLNLPEQTGTDSRWEKDIKAEIELIKQQLKNTKNLEETKMYNQKTIDFHQILCYLISCAGLFLVVVGSLTLLNFNQKGVKK